jgi:hypothetical protein
MKATAPSWFETAQERLLTMRERVAPVLAARQQHIFEFQTAKTPNRAVIARSEATKQSILSLCCAMDCFASLAMTSFYQTRLRIPATRSARIMPESSAPKRAWGMPGARCTRGLVRKGKWGCTHEHTGSAEAPGIPARDGFNGFLRALPGDRALLPPSFADRSTTLTPASGRQDHTTSPSAIAPFVKGATSVHRIPPQRP